jgi:hypothetical protein
VRETWPGWPAWQYRISSSEKIVSTEYATIYILDAGEDRFAASIRALRYGFAAHDRKDLVVEGKR